jgi:excisionase family DNA binding protein
MKPIFQDDELMTLAEVATRLRTGPGTIRNWRVVGAGPPGVRFGRNVLFRRSDVEAWINDKFEAPVSPPEFTPAGDAPARGRYFPWCVAAETVAEEVADALGASEHERAVIRNAVFDALPAFYDAYMGGIAGHAKHDASEKEALERFCAALTEGLRPVRASRETASPAEAS